MDIPRRSSVKKIKEIYERKSATGTRPSVDEKSESSIYRISRAYGFHKFLNKQYQEENEKGNENNQDINTTEEHDPENIEKNLKEFCVDMESLCEKYEKEICKYKKNLEERKSNYKSNPCKSPSAFEVNEVNTEHVAEKCDTSMNTDDLLVEDVREILLKIDNNLTVENKSNFSIIYLSYIFSKIIDAKNQKQDYSKEIDNNTEKLEEINNEFLNELEVKIKSLKDLIEIQEEKIAQYEKENLKLKELIVTYFNEEEIARLDKMDRKFNSYNNHINSMLDELILLKKSDFPVFKFFSKEAILESNRNRAAPPVKINSKESNQISSNFANYLKKSGNQKKDNSITQKDSNKVINSLKGQLQFANKILIELISEILFLEYKQEYLSINFSSINSHVLENFSVILNSLFLNEKIQSKSNPIDSNFSIYHEYLQDVFFKIYQIYLREKMSMGGDGKMLKNNGFQITNEFLTDEIIEIIVEEISNENSFFLLVYDSERDFLPLDEWFDYKIENLVNNNLQNLSNNNNYRDNNAMNNDEDYPGDETNRSLSYSKFSKFTERGGENANADFSMFMNNNNLFTNFDLNIIKNNKEEIKDNFTKRLDVLYDKFKYDLKLIISKARNYIHAGKIVCRNSNLYDFSRYYTDYSSIEIKNNEIFYNQMNISQDTIVNFDNLNYNLKYNRNTFKGFYYSMDSRLNGKFVTPKNISLTNTLVYLFNYSLPSLVTLSIRDYFFDEDSVINLMNIIEYTNCLSNLDISSNFLGDDKIRRISESLKINKTIKSLNLAYNNIGNNGAFYIGEFLHKNNFIERLFVSGNNLSGIGLQNLMKILSNHKSIKHLDISNNKLKEADIMAISNFITKNLRFEGLNISYNFLDMNTLNQIGLSFKENKTLKLFKGTNLGLNIESTPYLLQHLNDTNIEELYLDNNNIGETGGILISNVIKYNKKLKLASLKNCNLDPVALTCICHSFELNKNFKTLHLDTNKFDCESIEYLCNSITDKDVTVSLSRTYIENQIYERIAGIHNIILN